MPFWAILLNQNEKLNKSSERFKSFFETDVRKYSETVVKVKIGRPVCMMSVLCRAYAFMVETTYNKEAFKKLSELKVHKELKVNFLFKIECTLR